MTVFSKRNRSQPDTFRYDIPHEVRSRILHAIQQIADGYMSTFQFGAMLDDVGKKLLVEYGGLRYPGYEAARTSNDPVIEHFFCCNDEQALDFIEFCFVAFHNPGQQGVDAINGIFRDSAIGFELTPYVETTTDKPGNLFGRPCGNLVEVQHPKVIKRESEFLHSETTQPVLAILSDARYQGANIEFLTAHEHFRHGRFKETLNECLKAFESTMKIICHQKSWPYDQQDTARKLVSVCLDHGLVPTFSQQQLTSLRTLLESGVPTVRNKKSGHGQGVAVAEVPSHLARYALHLTGATILLLVESADAMGK